MEATHQVQSRVKLSVASTCVVLQITHHIISGAHLQGEQTIQEEKDKGREEGNRNEGGREEKDSKV